MATKPHKKITSTRSLYEVKEKSKIKNILKRLIHIKKGHLKTRDKIQDSIKETSHENNGI